MYSHTIALELKIIAVLTIIFLAFVCYISIQEITTIIIILSYCIPTQAYAMLLNCLIIISFIFNNSHLVFAKPAAFQ